MTVILQFRHIFDIIFVIRKVSVLRTISGYFQVAVVTHETPILLLITFIGNKGYMKNLREHSIHGKSGISMDRKFYTENSEMR